MPVQIKKRPCRAFKDLTERQSALNGYPVATVGFIIRDAFCYVKGIERAGLPSVKKILKYF